jgi:hypothetical protein
MGSAAARVALWLGAAGIVAARHQWGILGVAERDHRHLEVAIIFHRSIITDRFRMRLLLFGVPFEDI